MLASGTASPAGPRDPGALECTCATDFHGAEHPSSAMERAAALDALLVLRAIDAAAHQRGSRLLERIVAMLTKHCR
jgi:hypothetical protein